MKVNEGKKEPHDDADNYRPISIIRVFTKITKKNEWSSLSGTFILATTRKYDFVENYLNII